LPTARYCAPSRSLFFEDCYKAANEIYADHSKNNLHFKKLYESLVPYRNDAYAWLQVAELGFDSFQIRMRARA
jgi:TRAP-type mannitol/chloroaromatic compound transport system substrate-binding protein